MNQSQRYEKFKDDMDEAGFDVYMYKGRYFYDGPAVNTDEDGPTLQDIIRATTVEVQWDNMGKDFVVYPK